MNSEYQTPPPIQTLIEAMLCINNKLTPHTTTVDTGLE